MAWHCLILLFTTLAHGGRHGQARPLLSPSFSRSPPTPARMDSGINNATSLVREPDVDVSLSVSGTKTPLPFIRFPLPMQAHATRTAINENLPTEPHDPDELCVRIPETEEVVGAAGDIQRYDLRIMVYRWGHYNGF